MTVLEVKNLKKIYRTRFGGTQVQALSCVNFSVEEGEYVAIMGESGSGKTTLLNMLAALDKPTEGEVYLDGKPLSSIKDKNISEFRRDNLGFVFQEFNLLDTFNVKDNILLPLVLDRRQPDQEYFDKVTGLLGIADRLEALPCQLSGGQQQRAAIARALIYRPAILLADEPTGNLDRKNSQEVIDLLKMSNRNLKQTVILITHDEKAALEADRIVTLEDGRIVGDRKRG